MHSQLHTLYLAFTCYVLHIRDLALHLFALGIENTNVDLWVLHYFNN